MGEYVGALLGGQQENLGGVLFLKDELSGVRILGEIPCQLNSQPQPFLMPNNVTYFRWFLKKNRVEICFGNGKLSVKSTGAAFVEVSQKIEHRAQSLRTHWQRRYPLQEIVIEFHHIYCHFCCSLRVDCLQCFCVRFHGPVYVEC